MNPNNVILQTASKFAFFLIILFSIYIFFAGHNSPGGGFVGGLLTTGAFVVLLLAYDIYTVQMLLPFNSIIMVAVGLLLALGMASASLLFIVPFFTHAFNDFDLPLLGVTALHSATIFDAGVYLVVIGVAFTIIQSVARVD